MDKPVYKFDGCGINTADGARIFTGPDALRWSPELRKHGERIVRAVNAHDAMREALQRVNDVLTNGGDVRQAIKYATEGLTALAKAQEV